MKKLDKYVWAKQNVLIENKIKGITKNKKYLVYSEFKTNDTFSGLCYVIKSDSGVIIGFDADYFIDDLEVESKKYNI
jgi:hypothetical protein